MGVVVIIVRFVRLIINSQFSFILIANREDELLAGLDDRLASRLRASERIRVSRYTVDQFVDILRERATRELFSDLTFTFEDVVAANDEVALRWTMAGTHDGPLFGVEPTGEQVELTATEINRFQDGHLIETWTQSDQLGLMEQVGSLPATD